MGRSTRANERIDEMRISLACIGALFISSPAFADDWTLICTFGNSIESLVEYDAGWPRHTVALIKGGKDLKTHKALPAGRINAGDELLLFVNRDGEPKQERNLFIRINTETMIAKLEAGSGGFDYVATNGTCRTT